MKENIIHAGIFCQPNQSNTQYDKENNSWWRYTSLKHKAPRVVEPHYVKAAEVFFPEAFERNSLQPK